MLIESRHHHTKTNALIVPGIEEILVKVLCTQENLRLDTSISSVKDWLLW